MRALQRAVKTARAPALAYARIAPKISRDSSRKYTRSPKFHANRFTSGGVTAEGVKVVETRHKVFGILGEASTSSPSNNSNSKSRNRCTVLAIKSLPLCTVCPASGRRNLSTCNRLFPQGVKPSRVCFELAPSPDARITHPAHI